MSVILTVIISILINVLSVEATVHASFPIACLFDVSCKAESKLPFKNVGTTSATRAYHGRVIDVDILDSYTTAMEICKSTSDNKGIAALIDVRPTNGICDNTCLMCNRLNGYWKILNQTPGGIVLIMPNKISHLSLGWEPTESMSEDLYTLSYYPPPELTSKAYAALIRDLQWDKLAIFYEDEGSFVRLQEIINSWSYEKDPIIFRKIDPTKDNRETFKLIFKVERISYHIIDCDIDNLIYYINEIIQVDNSTQYQSFILTSLDTHLVNLKEVPDFKANVSTMHITLAKDDKWSDLGIDTSSGVRLSSIVQTEAMTSRKYDETLPEKVGSAPVSLARLGGGINNHAIIIDVDHSDTVRLGFLYLETALAADALSHLERAIRKMQTTENDENDDPRSCPEGYENPPAICYMETKMDYEAVAWPKGYELRDALLKTTAKGFTGNIEFDEEGKRTNLQLYYSKFDVSGNLGNAGYWDSKTDSIIVMEKSVEDRSTAQNSGVIRIVTTNTLPYYDKKTDENGTQLERGYAVDLINEIFENINKKYDSDLKPHFHTIPNNIYGSPIEGSKKWSGMVGELMDHISDLAVCDLSISSERNAVIDFSTPFMTTGISILFTEDDPVEPNMFSFILPLSVDVWLYLATIYIIVSFILLISARMSQDDWVNPHPCNQNPENLQNIWSFYNCLWLMMGSIMTQGCDILPRGIGSRWITGMWYFFAMIVTASYTANMSTFLSNSRRSNEIKDVKDLSEQNAVSYGAVLNASTYKFFEKSNDTVFSKIWTVMSTTKPDVFMKSNVEGKDRVLNGKHNFAFFMESTQIQYFAERNCQLKMIGGELDSKEYGIAMPKNSPLKGKVDSAILVLQESGRLSSLKKKWWTEEDNTEQCSKKKKENEEDDSGSLQMKNTSGIFILLIMGAFVGFVVAIIDFLLHVQKVSVREKVPFKEALISEWRACLNPRGLHKPTAPLSAPPTPSDSPHRERSQSRAVSVLRAATSFINFDEIY